VNQMVLLAKYVCHLYALQTASFHPPPPPFVHPSMHYRHAHCTVYMHILAYILFSYSSPSPNQRAAKGERKDPARLLKFEFLVQ
jgi:hypothetical protein